MDKKKLQNFLLKARTKTYAGNSGKVKPAFAGSDQLEYRDGDWLYRDVYFTGKGIFVGLEAVFLKGKPAWSMSYSGNFKKLTETEVDTILRKALLANWRTARTWNDVEWESGNYRYVCNPVSDGSINEMAGAERIFKGRRIVYHLFYSGGLVAK